MLINKNIVHVHEYNEIELTKLWDEALFARRLWGHL